MHIGIDLDNTIIDYQNQFAERAFALGYIDIIETLTKDAVKRKVKEGQDGEKKWGILQAEVYSEGISEAILMDGFTDFVNACRKRGVSLSVVSHKSRTNLHDQSNRNLQKPAITWLQNHCFFKQDVLGFNRSQIYFTETIEDKITRIKEINCTHFIDDLYKVLTHPKFPESTKKILYYGDTMHKDNFIVDYIGNWCSVKTYLFFENTYAN
jgi:hypothetical protein